MSGNTDGTSLQIVGQPSFEHGKEPHTDLRITTPGYFAAIGTELRSGRLFTEKDDAQAPRVVLANEAFAARFLRGMNPVGQRITTGGDKDNPMEIIGVVANVMNEDLDDLTEPCVYLPFAQYPVGRMNLIIRAPAAPDQIVPAVRREVATLDASLPLGEVKTMEQVIYERRSPKEVMMWMLGIFGLMALAMAAVGTYAVMAYSVAERTRELGVRIALGAQSADILKLVLRRGLSLTLLGILSGFAVALALTRVLAQMLYGVTATDLLTFAGVAGLLAGVALLACYLPARRATKVDPIIALRCE
jgi:putative ABC transport system permease protein